MFWNLFVDLCVSHNTKPNPVAKAIGVSSGAVTNWKNGATPSATTIQKIADYFSVNISYFYPENKEQADTNGLPVSEEDKEIIELLTSLPTEKKKAVLDYIRFVKSQRSE